MRRVVGIVAVLIGITLVGFTFTQRMFSRSRDAQTIADAYRPLMSARGLHDLRTGFEAVKAAGAELGSKAQPRLQQALGLDDQQFAEYLTREMPNIKRFDDQAPAVVKLVGPVISQMEAARSDYHRADQIPVGILGLSSAPWLFLAVAVLLIVAGGYAIARPGQLATVAVGLVGLAIVVAPLVLGIPGKVDAARRVTRLGAVGLAPATGQKAVGATALFDGMASDVGQKLEPGLGARLAPAGTDPRQAFAQAFPTLASWVESWQGGISAKSHDLSSSQVRLSSTFARANRIRLRPIPWLFIGPGAVLVVLALATLAAGRPDRCLTEA